MKYWDSSALVPLFVDEPSSAARRAIYRRDPDVVTWWGTLVECVSALNRIDREGRIADGIEGPMRELRLAAERWLEVEPVEEVRQRASALLAVHRLRAADALQLAAALLVSAELPTVLELVSNDERLSAAAGNEGMSVL